MVTGSTWVFSTHLYTFFVFRENVLKRFFSCSFSESCDSCCAFWVLFQEKRQWSYTLLLQGRSSHSHTIVLYLAQGSRLQSENTSADITRAHWHSFPVTLTGLSGTSLRSRSFVRCSMSYSQLIIQYIRSDHWLFVWWRSAFVLRWIAWSLPNCIFVCVSSLGFLSNGCALVSLCFPCVSP
jgi:hypothetical protein